jgi:hypothetical protein
MRLALRPPLPKRFLGDGGVAFRSAFSSGKGRLAVIFPDGGGIGVSAFDPRDFFSSGGAGGSPRRAGIGSPPLCAAFFLVIATLGLTLAIWVKGTLLFVVPFFCMVMLCPILSSWAWGTGFSLGGASSWAFDVTREICRGTG